jgi:hypothetical protein
MIEIVRGRDRWVIGMRVIETNHVEFFSRSILFTTQQLIRPDQKPIAFGSLLTRIRNGVRFHHYLISLLRESAKQQPATFVWIIALAMRGNFILVF